MNPATVGHPTVPVTRRSRATRRRPTAAARPGRQRRRPPRQPSPDRAVYAAYRESARDGTRDAAADDADRDSWAEALPSLRAAWEEHEDRYPERERATPLTHMDGSWSSGETRRLTPGQNTEATKACADIHDEGERVVLPAMRQIEAADPDRRLAGLEHMLKKADRLKEKIADALRARRGSRRPSAQHTCRTQCDSPSRTAPMVTLMGSERRRATQGGGFEEVKLKNLWSRASTRASTPSGAGRRRLRFEVQFHTPESLQAKELTHGAYERLRRPENETTPVERDELRNSSAG